MAPAAGDHEPSDGDARATLDGHAPDRRRGPRDDEDPGRSLWRGLITLAILVVLAVSLLLAVPGLRGVGNVVEDMKPGWVVLAVALEILSCVGYVLAFLQVFERVPLRLGARVALSELAFGAAVSVGGAGSVAVGPGCWWSAAGTRPGWRSARRSCSC